MQLWYFGSPNLGNERRWYAPTRHDAILVSFVELAKFDGARYIGKALSAY